MNLQLPYERLLEECGSKHLALYRALRETIIAGGLPPGERLPSSRQMAALYGLSRGSVSLAYEMLAAEGYVRAGVGQGTFVAGETGFARSPRSSALGADGERPDAPGAEAAPELSAWGRRIAQQASARIRVSAAASSARRPDEISFVPRGIGEKRFPWMEWRSSVAAQWKSLGCRADGPAEAEGSLELRRAIAGRLRRERGIVCRPEDVVVTGGSLQAIALLAQLLLDEGKTAVVENPCYPGTRHAVAATGAALLPARVDGEGIVPDDWEAGLLFVTPTRQFPTGAVLKLERRLELLAWAKRRRAWIVEDDYDSDFRWGGRPIEPLKSLDREGRVVYVGSFSRSMRSEVRIGYAVLPRALREPFLRAKCLYDPYPEGIAEQRALAGWMADGGYDRHMRRSRRSFEKLQAKLRTGLGAATGERFEVLPSDAGLLLFAYWRGSPEQYVRLVRRCRELGVGWGDGGGYWLDGAGEDGRPSALFGFAHLEEEEVEEGLARLRRAAESLGDIESNGESNEEQGGRSHA